VIGTAPPFSLARPSFRFRALANLAGRAPLGGEREMALAALMAARLADGIQLATPLTTSARTSRATGARLWCSTLTLPVAARAALGRVVDATEIGERRQVAEMLAAFAAVAGSLLDAPSRAELTDLVAALTAG
jgi:hypothetical protein